MDGFAELIERKRQGSLKIYLGYAAGVGKTYAMLEAAHVAKDHGRDVVVGYIEPHTRPDTLALLDGLGQVLGSYDGEGQLAALAQTCAALERALA